MRRIDLSILAAIIAILCFIIPLEAEIRALWALPWSTDTKGGLDSLITAAVESRQTDILIEVRYRSDALYKTNRLPDEFPNPEPRSHILRGSDFDPLEYALREGHKNNLRVHAWFVTFNATPVDSLLISQNYIHRNHPDWITYGEDNLQQQPGTKPGCFIDPGLPEVHDHLLNVIGDLLTGYPLLDGLHLDYVRYPGSRWGYHPISVAAYNRSRTGRRISWNQWRMEQVTSFVEKTRELVDSLSPGLVFSAAVIADPDKAGKHYAQDWLNWLQQGIIDYAYPMAYESDDGDFDRIISELTKDQLCQKIIVGIRAWNENGESLISRDDESHYNIMDVAEKIKTVREEGFAGISLFSYDGLIKDDALTHLANFSFSEKLIARMNFREYDQEDGIKYAADLNATSGWRHYDLELRLPAEGNWIWELRSLQDKMLYRRKAFYLKGINADHWNGVLADGSQIPAGWYLASIYRDRDSFKYVMPVTLPELN